MRRGEAAVELPPSKKTRALLAYLIVTGRPHRRERLCELFWDVPDDPRGSLRWSLSKIRALVDEPATPRLMADRQTISIDTAAMSIDLLAAQRCITGDIQDSDADALARAARLFQGAFLADLDLPDCHDFRAWCVAQREDARTLHVRVLTALIEHWRLKQDCPMPVNSCELIPIASRGGHC